MHTAHGRVIETILADGRHLVRIACPQALIPASGQYLLASTASDSPLAVPLFYTDSASDGFIGVTTGDPVWRPGTELLLRGPLGRGFALPSAARRVAFIDLEEGINPWRGFIRLALKQGAAVVLVRAGEAGALPDEVEVQPLSALEEVLRWADYAALTVTRTALSQWRARLGAIGQVAAAREAEVFVHAPVMCGGVAECGICAISLKSGWRMGCKDGPVFRWGDFGF